MKKLEKEVLKEQYFQAKKTNIFYIKLYKKNRTEQNNISRQLAQERFETVKQLIGMLNSNLLCSIENDWIIENECSKTQKMYLEIIKETLEIHNIKNVYFNQLYVFFDELQYNEKLPLDTKYSLSKAYEHYKAA